MQQIESIAAEVLHFRLHCSYLRDRLVGHRNCQTRFITVRWTRANRRRLGERVHQCRSEIAGSGVTADDSTLNRRRLFPRGDRGGSGGSFDGKIYCGGSFLDPWVNAWYSIPAIAFVPLVMNWTGLNYAGSIVIAFLIAVFSIILNVYSGIKNTNRSLVETALAYRANQFQVMYKVMLPASLPSIMVGLRLGLSRAIEGVIIAEMFFAAVGLGGMIDYSADHLQSATSDALILILALISVVLTAILKIVDLKVVAWKRSEAMSR